MRARVDTVLEIGTPEHLAFQVRIAGPGRRMFAYVVDFMLRAALLGVLMFLIFIVFGSVDLEGVGTGVLLVLIWLQSWAYYFAWEVLSGGRSAGKIWLKLRVVRTNGLPLTWRESLLRTLLRSADLLLLPPSAFLPLGPIVMAIDPRFRRLGDLLAGTIVVVEEKVHVQAKSAIEPSAETVAELPNTLPLDRDDLEALDLFVHRQQMSAARRRELGEIVAPEYARRLGRVAPRDPASLLASIWARAQDPKRRIEK